ncbi:zinc ribbon domain-containing protein [Desulfobotulus sp.]|jgi:radical SAM superfamily enzyme|uniref:zinc ribbon domain-containing protein n=1 Tax=Desulfobotulus sp. TaxID=1940337 RepID=UPI002A36A0EF|nr:zinc ribbon domain-containing protein [Desulfobotulus sp.]MDY0163400.1 zinc ribbon domain-containing protein [Desulfobotulus sp.]
MMNPTFCQSCGMPITEDPLKGTEKDGALTSEFCTYCYQKGAFTQNVTMEEMIEVCVPHMVDSGMAASEARALLENTLPNLARWHGK